MTTVPTHKDVIEFLLLRYNRSFFTTNNGKLEINRWLSFVNYDHDTLPNNMVFVTSCELDYSNIAELPDDIILGSSLSIRETLINELPLLDIPGFLDIGDTKATICNGTFIGGSLLSYRSNYTYLDYVNINGYFLNCGVLS